MLGIDPRAARAAWTVFLLALLVATAYTIRETLAVFVIALLFGYLLTPLVGLVERFTPKRVSFTFALAIVYLVLLGVILAMALTIGGRLVDEANSLAAQLPSLLKNGHALDQIPLPSWLEPARDRIVQNIQDELNGNSGNILPFIKSLGGHVISGVKYILYIFIIPILAFFFLKDGRGIQEEIVNSLVDENRRPVVESILQDVDLLLGEYIRALVLLAISGFVASSLFLGISGAPYAILLAVISAVGEFLPVVGPLGAGIVVLLVSSLAGYSHPIWYLLFWICFRIFQDYVFSPYIMGKGVKLNPMLVLFGLFAGEQVAGIIGMFLSVPVLATLRVVFVRLRRARTKDLIGASH
ncbi:MAG TPA: AI-2E family transporter [Bryobacteraceae bacterium]|nr:AI-2E family transporter [Bryobacteraceae bacterium]